MVTESAHEIGWNLIQDHRERIANPCIAVARGYNIIEPGPTDGKLSRASEIPGKPTGSTRRKKRGSIPQ